MNNPCKIKDSFGMLFSPVKIAIPGVISISPVDNYESVLESVADLVDGKFILPPITNTVKYDPETKEITHKGRSKAALIYGLPSTHTVEYFVSIDQDHFRRNDGAFILGLLNIIFNSRLQWADWWHEDKIPANVDPVAIIRNGERWDLKDTTFEFPDELSETFIMAYSNWSKFHCEAKKCLLNAMYFHQKAISYNWGFERFFSDYTAIDALWKCGEHLEMWPKHIKKKKQTKSKIGHADRIRVMIYTLKMFSEKKGFNGSHFSSTYCRQFLREIENLTKSRNDLLHEGLWGNGNPLDIGYANSACYKIHDLVKRLTLSILGVKNNYTLSPWWHLAHYSWK